MKISPSERRLNQVEREGHQRRKYLDRENKLTKHAQTILGKPPLIAGESFWAYKILLCDIMEYCGFEKVSDVISAGDIADDTWRIRRLVENREKDLLSIFSAEAIQSCRDHLDNNACDVKSTGELFSLVASLFAQRIMDPDAVLIAVLPKWLEVLDNYDPRIDRIRNRRKKTMEAAIKRRASRLRTVVAHFRGIKSQSKAEWINHNLGL